jgi:hypothetical protein
MPLYGCRWRHFIINTQCTWLHGDVRGFRDRDGRVESSGDYRRRPPEDEHEGLRKYFQERSGREVQIPRDVRATVGRALVEFFRAAEHRLLGLAVGKVHAHGVVELPDHLARVKWIIGQAKRKSSRSVKDVLPGSVWAAGGTYKAVDDRGHLLNAYEYVLYEQGPEAWTWSFRDKTDEGMFGRQRPPGNKHARRRRKR